MSEQIKKLNIMLATLEVAAANAKGRHWTTYGHNFRSVHLLLDDLWKTLRVGADKLAETIRVIDGLPLFRMSDFLTYSLIMEMSKVEDGLTYCRKTSDEVHRLIVQFHGAVENKVFDPTTENDVLNITSQLRHWLLFFDGIISSWEGAE